MRALQSLHVINMDFTTNDLLGLLDLKDLLDISSVAVNLWGLCQRSILLHLATIAV